MTQTQAHDIAVEIAGRIAAAIRQTAGAPADRNLGLVAAAGDYPAGRAARLQILRIDAAGRERRDAVPAGDPANLIALARFALQAARQSFDVLQDLMDAARSAGRDRPLTPDESGALSEALDSADRLAQKCTSASSAIE